MMAPELRRLTFSYMCHDNQCDAFIPTTLSPAAWRMCGAGSLGGARSPRARGPGRLTIGAVDAYPVYLNQRSEGLFDRPTFVSDDDPRRWIHNGPFAQIPSAIIAVIKTDEGITGFGMGAGGSVATEIIHGHLRHLLVGANPLNVEQLWDQMYSSAIFYGRRGVFAMVYCPRVLGQWFDGIRFYAAASSPTRSRRTWGGLR